MGQPVYIFRVMKKLRIDAAEPTHKFRMLIARFLHDFSYGTLLRSLIALRTAGENGRFPQDGGVRFPNAICSWCNFRGICLKDNRLRDELLVKIGPAAKEDDWLSELEAGEEE